MKIENIEDLLKGIKNGEIVLPDFQRSFVWEPDDVRELLNSICAGYFIGSMLTLDTTKDDSNFAFRLFEGVKEVNPDIKIQNIVKVILDGQQRSTALFYAVFKPDIPLKGRKSAYYFYLDLIKAIEGNWNEAVIPVNKRDKKRIKELNNRKSDGEIIPFSELWTLGFTTVSSYAKKLWRKYEHELKGIFKEKYTVEIKDPEDGVNKTGDKIWEISKNFKQYKLHIVDIPYKEPEKIVETFERINKTGEPLSVFDLVVARLYRDRVNPRKLLENTQKNYDFIDDEGINPQMILKVIALLRDKEPKRGNLLNLESKNFESDWEIACEFLEKAYRRMTDIKNGYGILNFKKWTPYSTMIVPLAVMIYEIEKIKGGAADYEKIDKWYWTIVFGQRYDQAVDAQSFSDFNEFKKWVINGEEPSFLKDFKLGEVDLEVSKQNNAIYRGIINLITLKGAFDFKTGQPPQFDRKKIQDDHIFPKSKYKEDKILNKTIITTNQSKIDKDPSEYFSARIKEFGKDKVKKILKTHLIPTKALDSLLSNNLKEFMELRKQEIIKEIKIRMGL